MKKILLLFRYPGGKFYALSKLKSFWETPHDEYREPLVGGGAVFFGKPKVTYQWINDIDNELINTYKIMKNGKKVKELIKRVENEEATKKRHSEIKKLKPSNMLDLAYRYFYLNRTSYSGIMKLPAWGYHEKKSVHPDKWGERILQANRKLKDTKITNMDYEKVILTPAQGKSTFMFIDPPYFEADQKRAYVYSFDDNEHIRLCNILKQTDHKFCLSYDDCEPIRELYNWANIHPVSWRYNTSNSNKSKRKMGNELLITNF